MHFVFNALFLLAGIKWGDWRNWKEYYPTILFLIGGDLLKNALLKGHLMWEYQEVYFGENILIGHLAIDLMIMAIVYPSTILIYLGHFPRTLLKQILWVALWVCIYSGVEFINLRYLNLIDHHRGWSMEWSIIFNVIMFVMLRIHFKKPLLAWGLSLVWLLFLWNWFDVPKDLLK